MACQRSIFKARVIILLKPYYFCKTDHKKTRKSSDEENSKLETDEEFARRHHKYELEEKRLIKKDALIKDTRSKVFFDN